MRSRRPPVLRPLEARHTDAVQRLAAHPEIAATTRIPHPFPEHGARDFIAAMQVARAAGTAQVFAIERDGELVGLCGLHDIQGDEARDLGYWVGRPYWGQGLATFAVGKLLEFAFRELGLRRVGAAALAANTASRRVLEKHRFRCLHVAPHQDPRLKHPDEPLATYAITAAEWQAADMR